MKVIRMHEQAYDETDLEKYDFEFAIYYYECEGYEGLGKCLALKEKKWYVFDLSHCSCYGAFDSISLEEPHDSLKLAIKTLHRNDWTKYFNLTINQIYEKVKMYTNGTLLDNTIHDYEYARKDN
jgi:hypothetical protein